MNFDQCLQYLQQRGDEVLAMRFGLETTQLLLERLGSPHLRFPSVLIAGTNGKGSTARFLAAILQRAGFGTGLYTSPHLVRVTERMRISGAEIDQESFAAHVTRTVEAAASDLSPTYFELLTVAAFCWFAERRVDLAVLEVGMGGRLDSTNVVRPEVALISKIGIDHQRFLGDTIEAIAQEKAGILVNARRGWTVTQEAAAAFVLQREARRFGVPLQTLDGLEILGHEEGRFRFSYRNQQYQLASFGAFQVENAGLALAAALELRDAGFAVNASSLREGIEDCRVEGTLMRVDDTPPLFLDGGHNPQAAHALAQFAERYTPGPRALVFGIMRDKDVRGVLEALRPVFESVCFVPIQSKRAASPQECLDFFGSGDIAADSVEGLQRVRRLGRTTFATGSFYLVGELLARSREWRRLAAT